MTLSGEARKRGWGGVARRGAGVLGEDAEHAGEKDQTASKAWREAVQRARGETGDAGRPAPWEPERFVADDEAGSPPRSAARSGRSGTGAAPRRAEVRAAQATGAPRTGAQGDTAEYPGRPRKTPAERLPAEVGREVERLGSQSRRVMDRLGEATRAYERDRYDDARRTLRGLVEQAPDVASIRELYGLTLYRIGRWQAAIKELEAFNHLSASLDQHPVLADCYRALGRLRQVERVWDEMRRGGVGADVMAEGRLVLAGAHADRGDLATAIEVLARGKADVRSPKLHHLRVWYALADLYERAGEVPRARELFRRVLDHDPEFHDAGDRLRALR